MSETCGDPARMNRIRSSIRDTQHLSSVRLPQCFPREVSLCRGRADDQTACSAGGDCLANAKKIQDHDLTRQATKPLKMSFRVTIPIGCWRSSITGKQETVWSSIKRAASSTVTSSVVATSLRVMI